MSSLPKSEPIAKDDLLLRWQDIGNEWARWWADANARLLTPSLGADAGPWTASISALGSMPGTQELAALNEKYRPRWEALWSATTGGRPFDAAAQQSPGPSAGGDRRFAAKEWNELPYFALMKAGYLLASDYLSELATLPALPESEKRRLQFVTKQYLDALAPTNFLATNPEVLQRALESNGASLTQGLANLAADAQRGRISMSDSAAFAVGRNLAVTPGSIVFRNELIELIQYAPTTAEVYKRPLLIVPPCINKYYILDLQPENSFARWAVGEGHTVFMVSWRNIPPELGHLTWDDYLEKGVLSAIEIAKEVSASKTINALGFCVGGTLLACALGVLAARHDRSVESATLLTTMLDFADPGEIGVYVSRELLAAREPALLAGQRIKGSELAGAFASLRANDLVWNYYVNNYLKGETPPAFDLLFWNGDSSNLPGPMYVYYLTNMYLDNKLKERGALTMAGEEIDLARATVPTYLVASRDDHIVPWRSAYKSTGILGGDITFVLGASGHIAGVVNPPAKNRRNYWINDLLTDDPDDWLARAASHPGSWWTHWGAWLAPHGGTMHRAPRMLGTASNPAQYPAPGRYVVEGSQ